MDKRQITSYVNLAALICYIIGRVLNIGFLVALGLTIMTIGAIWSLIHWKENDKITNYLSIGFLVLVGLSLLKL